MNRSLILGGLALLLLLGCAGRPGYQAPAQPSGSPAGSSGMQIGDSDISPQPTVNESDTLSNEPVAPADNGTAAANATPANVSQNLTALPNDSDLLVDNTTNEDLISQQDVVEPP